MGTMNIEWSNFAESELLPNADVSSKNLDGNFHRRVYLNRRNISGIDAIVEGVENILVKEMRIKHIANSGSAKRYTMYIGDDKLMVVFAKKGSRYYINGLTANVGVLTKAIARTIIRAASKPSYDELEDYLYKCIELPESISYVLENKLPYNFYEMEYIGAGNYTTTRYISTKKENIQLCDYEMTEHECRLEVKQIDEETFAIELFSGVWGEINLKQLCSFINTFWKGQKRGQWSSISPEELYYKLIGDKASDSQIKVMIEFLKQNRKEDIVERRAMQLVEDLANTYDTIKIGNFGDKKCMYVRGKITDWMVVESGSKHGIQDVATYALVNGKESHLLKCHVKTTRTDCRWTGPICIDNQQTGASVGDQFAARAFACMNDSLTVQLVSTMESYIKSLEVGQTKHRLNWDALS